MIKVIEVTEDSFNLEVLQERGFVLVDFWAEWCNPCKTLTSILENMSQDPNSTFKIVKISVDENEKLSQSFGIFSVPTLVLFKSGSVLDTKIGLLSRDQILRWIDSFSSLST